MAKKSSVKKAVKKTAKKSVKKAAKKATKGAVSKPTKKATTTTPKTEKSASEKDTQRYINKVPETSGLPHHMPLAWLESTRKEYDARKFPRK